MLVGIHKGWQQGPIPQFHPLGRAVLLRQLVSHVFDSSVMLYQIAKHVVSGVYGQDIPTKTLHLSVPFLTCRLGQGFAFLCTKPRTGTMHNL